MIITASKCFLIFQQAIDDYHVHDDVDHPMANPHPDTTMPGLLYRKCWIDTVQWHLEDLIRVPEIDPTEALALKRRIDASNQERTDTVEQIDDFFVEAFREVAPQPGARLNSESPAWLLDRMSILMLKICHMQEQTDRSDAGPEHIARCRAKLDVLLEQKTDMKTAYTQLLEDIASGIRTFKVYRQMKMYNDATLNPKLYEKKV
jgi:hypothetical protein